MMTVKDMKFRPCARSHNQTKVYQSLTLFKREGYENLFSPKAVIQYLTGVGTMSRPSPVKKEDATYCICDPEMIIDGVKRGGGFSATNLGELAKKCYNERFLRVPFSITTIPAPDICSSGYNEIPVELREITEFLEKYYAICKKKEPNNYGP